LFASADRAAPHTLCGRARTACAVSLYYLLLVYYACLLVNVDTTTYAFHTNLLPVAPLHGSGFLNLTMGAPVPAVILY